MNISFWGELVPTAVGLTSSHQWWLFLMRLVVLIWSNETCQHLENPANEYFPNDQSRIVQNHGEDPLQVKTEPVGVGGIESPSHWFSYNFLKIYLFICLAASGLTCGTRDPMLWLSCPAACGILVLWPGIKPMSPPLAGRFLNTGPPEKLPLVAAFTSQLLKEALIGSILATHWRIPTVTWASPVEQLVKNPPANAGDMGSIPGSGRSLGAGNGYSL